METRRYVLGCLLLMFCGWMFPVMASSLGDIRVNARFLTDRMAFELNLTSTQYNDLFEINYDFLNGVDPYLDEMALSQAAALDVYYRYLDERNDDLRWVLSSAEYTRFMALEYFFRPIYAVNRVCYLRIYKVYSNRTFFYFAPPVHYVSYRGIHSRRYCHGVSFYRTHYARRYHHPVYKGGFHCRPDHHHHDFRPSRPNGPGYHFTPVKPSHGSGHPSKPVVRPPRPQAPSHRPDRPQQKPVPPVQKPSRPIQVQRPSKPESSKRPSVSRPQRPQNRPVVRSPRQQANPGRGSSVRRSVKQPKDSSVKLLRNT